MNGKYKGYSKTAETALIVLSIAFIPVFHLLTNAPAVPALITIGLALASIIVLVILTSCLPCRFEADEKGFTMKRLFITKHYDYNKIMGVKCIFHGTTRIGKAIMLLSLIDENGEKKEFLEISRYMAADVVNKPELCKPQLARLCEYINSVR